MRCDLGEQQAGAARQFTRRQHAEPLSQRTQFVAFAADRRGAQCDGDLGLLGQRRQCLRALTVVTATQTLRFVGHVHQAPARLGTGRQPHLYLGCGIRQSVVTQNYQQGLVARCLVDQARGELLGRGDDLEPVAERCSCLSRHHAFGKKLAGGPDEHVAWHLWSQARQHRIGGAPVVGSLGQRDHEACFLACIAAGGHVGDQHLHVLSRRGLHGTQRLSRPARNLSLFQREHDAGAHLLHEGLYDYTNVAHFAIQTREQLRLNLCRRWDPAGAPSLSQQGFGAFTVRIAQGAQADLKQERRGLQRLRIADVQAAT